MASDKETSDAEITLGIMEIVEVCRQHGVNEIYISGETCWPI